MMILFRLLELLLVSIIYISVMVSLTVAARFSYPEVRRDDSIVDFYHGTPVKDPYRWLEDGESEETKKFIRDQNKLTKSFLEEIDDRSRIRDKLEEIWNFPKYMNAPTKVRDRYYFYKNSGLQNHGLIYVQSSLSNDEEPEVFLDPNTLLSDGQVSLRDYHFSKDGTIFGYCLSKSGVDWKTCHFRNVTSGLPLPDKVEGLKFSGLQWSHDNLGFFYTFYPKNPNGSRQLDNEKGWYHKLGTSQSDDILILDFPSDPSWTFAFEMSDDGKYLMAFPNTDFKANAVFLVKLDRGIYPYMSWTPVFSNITEASYKYVTNEGSTFYFQTDRQAPRSQIIMIETERAKNPRLVYSTFIPEHTTDVLQITRAVATNKLFMVYMEDMIQKIEVRNLVDGEIFANVSLDVGSVWSVNQKVRGENELFFLFESFVIPARLHHCNFTDENVSCSIFKQSKIANMDVSNIESHQVFYPSRDNTKIPMFIVHKKGVDRNGTSPVLLYGYGGFNSNVQPSFEIQNLIFIKYFDGIYAVPGLRGGGEYGESWHAAGSLLNKKNVFNDFEAAAQYLIRERYTTSSRLTITGTSNGGLLVGSCVNRNPGLYGTAIAKVGVMDMVRYQKLGVGFWWTEEYGSTEFREHFRNLISYSPLHTVQKYMLETVQYPAMLVLTGDHDDRVEPAHSYKYAAELQYRIGNLSQQKNPLLLHVATNVGHGLGRTPAEEISEWADIFAFISKTLNLEFSYASANPLHSISTLTIFLCIAMSLLHNM